MAPRTRSRILVLLIVVAVIAAVREYCIRCHEADLHDWPAPDDAPTSPRRNGS